MKKSVTQRPVTIDDTQRDWLTREGTSAESGGKQLFFFHYRCRRCKTGKAIRPIHSAGGPWGDSSVGRTNGGIQSGCTVLGSSPGLPAKHQHRNDMKKRAEQMAGRAIMQLTEVAMRYLEDVGQVLTEMEATHDDAELTKSLEYQTLLAGHSGLQEMMDRMNQQINKDI